MSELWCECIRIETRLLQMSYASTGWYGRSETATQHTESTRRLEVRNYCSNSEKFTYITRIKKNNANTGAQIVRQTVLLERPVVFDVRHSDLLGLVKTVTITTTPSRKRLDQEIGFVHNALHFVTRIAQRATNVAHPSPLIC